MVNVSVHMLCTPVFPVLKRIENMLRKRIPVSQPSCSAVPKLMAVPGRCF